MSDIVITRPAMTVQLSRSGNAPVVKVGGVGAAVTIVRDGVPGPRGPAGSASTIDAVADVAVAAGMPLAISRATGHFVKADAASKPIAFVAGLAQASTSVGFVASSVRDSLTLADWTAITGSTALAVGQTYFLGAGGGLTTTPPGPPNCITAIGIAASATTLIIEPENPIQL